MMKNKTSLSDMVMSRRTFGTGLALAVLSGNAPSLLSATETGTIGRVLDAQVSSGNVPGLVALVARGLATDVHVAGVRDVATSAPMERDTIFAVASIGKPITAVSAMILVEEGILDLDEPVDKWLPELANRRVIRSLDADLDDTVPARRAITPRDLLTMRMGIGAVFADPAGSPLLKRMTELELSPGPKLFSHSAEEYMRRIESLPLVHHPGERWLYHTGMDVAGVLVERASGRKLGDFQRDRIFEPLGMKDTGFWVQPEKAQRLATCYRRKPETGKLNVWNPASGSSFLEPPPFEAGGGGQVSTVDDFLAFGRLLLGRGLYGDKRLLQESSVAEMVKDQIPDEVKTASPFFPGFWDTHGWGLGISIITTPDQISPRPGRFGWWGGFGTTFFADPNADVVALLFTQRLMGSADDTKMSEEFLKLAFSRA